MTRRPRVREAWVQAKLTRRHAHACPVCTTGGNLITRPRPEEN